MAKRKAKQVVTKEQKAKVLAVAEQAHAHPWMIKEFHEAGWFAAADQSLRGIDVAEIFGVNKQTVTDWVKRNGCPRNRDKTYSLRDVMAWHLDWKLTRQAEELIGSAPNEEGARDENGVNWKQRKERADAQMQEAKLAQRLGKLVPLADVESREIELGVFFKDTISGLGAKLAPMLYGQEISTIEQAINDEIRSRLGELCQDVE